MQLHAERLIAFANAVKRVLDSDRVSCYLVTHLGCTQSSTHHPHCQGLCMLLALQQACRPSSLSHAPAGLIRDRLPYPTPSSRSSNHAGAPWQGPMWKAVSAALRARPSPRPSCTRTCGWCAQLSPSAGRGWSPGPVRPHGWGSSLRWGCTCRVHAWLVRLAVAQRPPRLVAQPSAQQGGPFSLSEAHP